MTSLGSQKDTQDTPFTDNFSLFQGWSRNFMPSSHKKVSQKRGPLQRQQQYPSFSSAVRLSESDYAQVQGSSGKLL